MCAIKEKEGAWRAVSRKRLVNRHNRLSQGQERIDADRALNPALWLRYRVENEGRKASTPDKVPLATTTKGVSCSTLACDANVEDIMRFLVEPPRPPASSKSLKARLMSWTFSCKTTSTCTATYGGLIYNTFSHTLPLP